MLRIRMAWMMQILLLFTFFVWIHADPGTADQRPVIQRTNSNKSVDLLCQLEGSALENYKWTKISGGNNTERFEGLVNAQGINEKHGTVHFDNVIREDNGTYECSAHKGGEIVKRQTQLIVVEKPEIVSFNAEYVMPDKIYLEWEVHEHNTKIIRSEIVWRLANHKGLESSLTDKIRIKRSHFLAEAQDLKENTSYEIGIRPMRYSRDPEKFVPLEKPFEGDFVLRPEISGTTNSSITITWNPPRNLTNYYYYEVNQTQGDSRTDEDIHLNINTTTLTIPSLQDGIDYHFKVRFCIIKEHVCGNWSEELTGNTDMGIPMNAGNQASGADGIYSKFMNLFTIIIFSLLGSKVWAEPRKMASQVGRQLIFEGS